MDADQRQFDAIILFGTAFRDETLRDRRLGPCVPPKFVLARDSRIAGVPAVACDTQFALKEIVDYLFDRGYRRPGFMTGARTLSTALGRRRHYLEFWHQKGVSDIVELSTDRYSADAARGCMMNAAPGTRVDILMCEDVILAIGAMDVIRSEFGLRVPQGIAIVGFDNLVLGETPP